MPIFSSVRSYPSSLDRLADFINQPELPELTRRFLFDQLEGEDGRSSAHVNIDDLPFIFSGISVFHSAVATFYAPSDESGIHGMRRETIRSTPSWRGGPPRRDCAFVVEDQLRLGMKGMSVVRVMLFFSFIHGGIVYPCALVEWFKRIGRSPDAATGMWKVRPEDDRCGGRVISVLHLDSFLRGAHLIPVYGEDFIPVGFKHTDSLDAFAAFYVNKYADHHAHEIAF